MAATSTPPAGRPPADFLERERARMAPTGLVALAAALLLILGNVLESVWAYHGLPHVYVLDAVRDAAGQSIGREGLSTDQVIFFSHKGFALIIVGLCEGLSWIAVGVVLMFLLRAAVNRGARLAQMVPVFLMVGVAATAIATVGLRIAVAVSSHNFATSSDHSSAAAHDALSNAGAVVAAHALGAVGNLILAGVFVLITLNAMRVGLLTRFLGVLGVIVGVLVVLSALAGSSSFFVQALWLLLIGMMLLGRSPAGLPPAWRSGEAMPWPSQQELREAREQRARSAGGAPQPAADGPAEGSARRKRKRRS